MPKRVLMITEYYYPNNCTAAHRPGKFAKYLLRFGWTPVVLCQDWTSENSCTPYSMYDPLLAAAGDLCQTVRIRNSNVPVRRGLACSVARFMLRRVFPFRSLCQFSRAMITAALELHDRGPFDAIWSTQPAPFISHIASMVAARTGLPWVADYRDLPGIGYMSLRQRLRVREVLRFTESARALTTVTKPWADRLAACYAVPVHVITNGFDPDDFPPRDLLQSKKFTIRYFGMIYRRPGYMQDPSPLFSAIGRLAEARRMNLEDIRVEFYGTPPASVKTVAERYQCARVVHIMPRVSWTEAVRLEQEAVVLLLLGIPEYGGTMPSKVFGYLAAKRPILGIHSDKDTIHPILATTCAGKSADDPDAIGAILEPWYLEWKRTGTVARKGRDEEVVRYSYVQLTGRLAAVLDGVFAEAKARRS